jgi:hypothetical protein
MWGGLTMGHNILLDTETQLKAAASPSMLCSGQRKR